MVILRKGSSVTREYIYKLSSFEALNCIKKAEGEFNSFKRFSKTNKQLAHEYLQSCLKLYKNAIDSCKLETDKAYCQRRFATTIIRDESISADERHTLAKEQLVMAIHSYEASKASNDIIVMELQRSYVLLGHIAIELLDG